MKKKFKRHLHKMRYIIYQETLIDYREHFFTFLGSFIGIGVIGFMNSHHLKANDNMFLIGSFGASSVLIYGIINSPFSQPRNLIGGHLISALVGVTVHKLIPQELWLACATSVSLSIVLMQMTKTLHPPGGATALIANIGSEKIKKETGILTGAVGLITTSQQAEAIVAGGKADLVLVARESLRNPNLGLHFAQELGVDVQWPKQYERAKK